MTKERAAETGEGYYDAYDAVTKSDLGKRVLETREQVARMVEEQPGIND